MSHSYAHARARAAASAEEEKTAALHHLGDMLRECVRHRGVLQRRLHNSTMLVNCRDIADGWVGDSWELNITMVLRDGREMVFADSSRPVTDSQGQVTWYRPVRASSEKD